MIARLSLPTLLASLVGALGVFVVARDAPSGFDAWFLQTMLALRSEALTQVVLFLTDFGGRTVMVPLSVLVIVAVAVKRRRTAVFMTCAIAGSAIVNETAKMLFGRARPTIVEAVMAARGLSFPSGHSQASMAFALTMILALRREGVRHPSVWLMLLFPVIVGWTRTYLGVHYPSDVLAGWMLGAACVLTVHYLIKPSDPNELEAAT